MKPAAYLHTVKFFPEGEGGIQQCVSFSKEIPWGMVGKSYIDQYEVMVTPLPTLEAVLNCYSPDDTVGDYQDKIRALYAPVKRNGEPVEVF